MKILYLMGGTKTGIGGIESLMPYILERMMESGIDAHLISQYIPKSYEVSIYSSRIHKVSVPFTESGLYSRLPVIFRYPVYIIYFLRLFFVVIMIKPDIIHSQWYGTSLIAFIANKLLNIPYIHTFHSSVLLENYLPSAKLSHYMEKIWKNNFVFKNASVLTAVSSSLSTETETIINCPVSTVGNGIDISYFSLPDKSAYIDRLPRIIVVSRITPVKLLKDAIFAVKLILSIVPNCQLLIVGDGEQRVELEEYVFELGLENIVVFVGAVPHRDTKKYYHLGMVYLLCSETEGFCLSLLEAMACGLPFVSTPVGIAPSVCNGNNGTIVPIHNPQRIAEACVKYLLMSSESIYSIAQENHHIASHYSWDNICQNYIGIYSSILNDLKD